VNRFAGTGSVESLGDREVGVIASTNQLARDGHVLEPSGIDLVAYKLNPIVLWSHQPEQPVGVATAVAVQGGALAARVLFADPGVSDVADEICGLVKSGVVRGVSIGFLPTECEPLDPKDPWGGQHIIAAELLEISFVSVPADTGAAVTARAFASRPGALAMLRSLSPISRTSVDRVLQRLRHVAPGERRAVTAVGSMNQYERYAHDVEQQRQRTMTCWAIGHGREAEHEARYSLENRLRTLAKFEAEQLELESAYARKN
jgi:HK97 family phage prohead protease